jgi:hypothetical protein
MDTAAILALWEEDGVDLMPGDAAMIGKKKISAWVEDIVAKMPGYKVTMQEMEFHDIHVCGDWASEWATEHQVVQPPDGKPPIESYGKMALVLRPIQTAIGGFGRRCGTRRRSLENNPGKRDRLALVMLDHSPPPSSHFLKKLRNPKKTNMLRMNLVCVVI